MRDSKIWKRSKYSRSGKKKVRKRPNPNSHTVKILRIRQKMSENGQIQIRIRQKSSGSGPKCPETTESKSATLDQYPLYLLNIIFNNNLIFLLILHNESTCIVYCLQYNTKLLMDTCEKLFGQTFSAVSHIGGGNILKKKKFSEHFLFQVEKV